MSACRNCAWWRNWAQVPSTAAAARPAWGDLPRREPSTNTARSVAMALATSPSRALVSVTLPPGSDGAATSQ